MMVSELTGIASFTAWRIYLRRAVLILRGEFE
jgi:hypothetical protein